LVVTALSQFMLAAMCDAHTLTLLLPMMSCGLARRSCECGRSRHCALHRMVSAPRSDHRNAERAQAEPSPSSQWRWATSCKERPLKAKATAVRKRVRLA